MKKPLCTLFAALVAVTFGTAALFADEAETRRQDFIKGFEQLMKNTQEGLAKPVTKETFTKDGMQAGAILLTRIFKKEEFDGRLPVVAKMGEVRFKKMVHPGDTIFLEVKFKDRMAGAYFLDAKVTTGGKTSAQFDIVCALTKLHEGPPEASFF
jgi:hypothetical protein